MRLYRAASLPQHWIGEDGTGALMLWPARRGGWRVRTAYTGPRKALEAVDPRQARGTGWPGGGRGAAPRSPAGEASERRVTVRGTGGEVGDWTRCADHDGKPLATWARDVLNAEVARRRR